MLAEVLVNLPVKSIYRTFTYRIPPTLSHLDVGEVEIGRASCRERV